MSLSKQSNFLHVEVERMLLTTKQLNTEHFYHQTACREVAKIVAQ
jgi:hypothetical protein